MTTIRTGDDHELHLHDWSVSGAKATVALLHGYGEHAGRYKHLAAAFNERGISVIAADLRGHGRSEGTRGHVDRFADYHLDATAIWSAAVERSGGGPVLCFGHSMGGLLALDWLTSGAERRAAGVVLSSPFFGVALHVNPIKKFLGVQMSRFFPKFALPTGLSGTDVCRDPEQQRLYDTDPLNNKSATARWYTEAMAAIDRVFSNAKRLSAPTLLLYGGADKVADADATDRFAASLTVTDKTVDRLDGRYHELVNELPDVREALLARMADWIVCRQ